MPLVPLNITFGTERAKHAGDEDNHGDEQR